MPDDNLQKRDKPEDNPAQAEILAKLQAASGGDAEMAMTMASRQLSIESGMQSPFEKHITAEHVKQVLDTAAQHDNNEFELIKDATKREHDSLKLQIICGLIGLGLILLALVIVLLVYKQKPEAIAPLITGFGGLLAGGVGGYGAGVARTRRRQAQ